MNIALDSYMGTKLVFARSANSAANTAVISTTGSHSVFSSRKKRVSRSERSI